MRLPTFLWTILIPNWGIHSYFFELIVIDVLSLLWLETAKRTFPFVRCKYMMVFFWFLSVSLCILMGTLPQTFPKSAIVLKMQLFSEEAGLSSILMNLPLNRHGQRMLSTYWEKPKACKRQRAFLWFLSKSGSSMLDICIPHSDRLFCINIQSDCINKQFIQHVYIVRFWHLRQASVNMGFCHHLEIR